jgi:NADP-dependent 3-hydroxy acid dehydrogenase YdfG
MKDKVIAVTGASGGIGAAVTEMAAARGALVALIARRKTELDKIAALCGPQCLVVVADITDRSAVRQAVLAVIARFGRVDVWINNAGQGITRLPSELTDEDIDTMMKVNVKTALYGMQEVLPHFKKRNSGHMQAALIMPVWVKKSILAKSTQIFTAKACS